MLCEVPELLQNWALYKSLSVKESDTTTKISQALIWLNSWTFQAFSLQQISVHKMHET